MNIPIDRCGHNTNPDAYFHCANLGETRCFICGIRIQDYLTLKKVNEMNQTESNSVTSSVGRNTD